MNQRQLQLNLKTLISNIKLKLQEILLGGRKSSYAHCYYLFFRHTYPLLLLRENIFIKKACNVFSLSNKDFGSITNFCTDLINTLTKNWEHPFLVILRITAYFVDGSWDYRAAKSQINEISSSFAPKMSPLCA